MASEGPTRVEGGDVRYVKNDEESASSEPNFSQPSLFRPTPLMRDEVVVDGRIRTASLAILATTCLCFAVYYLKAVLVPFVIALALKFLLTPIIVGPWASNPMTSFPFDFTVDIYHAFDPHNGRIFCPVHTAQRPVTARCLAGLRRSSRSC